VITGTHSVDPKPRRVQLTYREYAYLPDDGRRYELMDGELYMTPAPTPHHQTVSRRLQYALMAALEEPGIAFVFNAPIDVILGDTNVVQPDLAIVRSSRRELITDRGIEGAPDVVVEILSPGTSGRDRHLKTGIYARHGVPEYWIVDPDHGWIDVHALEGEGGGYGLVKRFDRADTLRSALFPEIAVPMAPLFRPL
jgi:Uma2 family endonuclease